MWFFKNYGILGQNARNLNYISLYNDEKSKKLADSKLNTKDFLSKKGINTSQTICIIKDIEELKAFDLDKLDPPFVVKPNAGYGGKGILVIDKKDDSNNFITNYGNVYSKTSLYHHIEDILAGFYSLSGNRDMVFFERKIVLDHSIDLIGKYGLPDIRIIVFNKVPVIAMLRVPTQNSKGKANLHSGACGVGIDISTGKLTNISQFGKLIKSIPGIGDVRGTELPHWDEVLKLAVSTQMVTNIGYIGCDIVLDDTLGPIVLEVNVRPGLEVQVVNRVPLRERLQKVENIKINSIEKGIRLGKDLFGGDIEEKIKNVSGKKVLGNREYIEIKNNDKILKCIGEIKVNQVNSYISKEFLENTLNYDLSKTKNDFIKLKINILGESKTIKFFIKDKIEKSNLVLGKDSLYGYLIDPFKYKDTDLPTDFKNPLIKEKNKFILKGYETQLLKLDKEIIDIDKKLTILKPITPINIEIERDKFINSQGNYILQLEYNELTIDLIDLKEKILKIEIPDIPLCGIYKRKKEEIINKINFLKAFKDQNINELNKNSKLLYGTIIDENLDYSKQLIFNKSEIYNENEFLSFEDLKNLVNKFNHIYGLDLELKERNIVSRFMISKDKLYIKPGSLVGKKEVRSIIAHEIEGHYLRKINARKQKYSIFSYGTAGYVTDEEGIATYNQNKFLSKSDKKYYYNTERYYFIDYMLNHNYKDSLEELKRYYNNDYEAIFKYLIRFKRGVKNIKESYCFTKDVIYLNGYIEIRDFIKNGGSIKELYFGKIGIKDLEEIKKSEFIDIKVDDFKIPLFY